jgi:hypothetical protein
MKSSTLVPGSLISKLISAGTLRSAGVRELPPPVGRGVSSWLMLRLARMGHSRWGHNK